MSAPASVSSLETLPRKPAASVQVAPEHYSAARYDELHRWISYWYQIQTVARAQPRRVLEVGSGTGVLRWYMQERLGLEVTTVDCDATRSPDIVADVRSLSEHVGENEYDLVCAFQVLEHLPFEDFPRALEELARISRDRVAISLPNNGHFFQLRAHVWRFKLAFGRKLRWNRDWTFDGEHYWEVGTRGHMPDDVRHVLLDRFVIEHEEVYPDYPYHVGYDLRKRT